MAAQFYAARPWNWPTAPVEAATVGGRGATVTPSANSAQGAAAFGRNGKMRSSAIGGVKCTEAESTPNALATSSGWPTTRRKTSHAIAGTLIGFGRDTAIRNGTSVNR